MSTEKQIDVNPERWKDCETWHIRPGYGYTCSKGCIKLQCQVCKDNYISYITNKTV